MTLVLLLSLWTSLDQTEPWDHTAPPSHSLFRQTNTVILYILFI